MKFRKTGTTAAVDRVFVEAILARGTAEPTAERTVRVWVGDEARPETRRLIHLTPEEMQTVDRFAGRVRD